MAVTMAYELDDNNKHYWKVDGWGMMHTDKFYWHCRCMKHVAKHGYKEGHDFTRRNPYRNGYIGNRR